MTVVPDSRPAVAPASRAGLLLAARGLLAELALPHPRVGEVLEATGATRSRAYELRDAILALLPGLVRPPGRPRTEREPSPQSPSEAIGRQVLRFVMDHPGCVHGGPRRRSYADEFRHRVLELRAEHPDLDLPDFARAVGVPMGTVEDWLRPGGPPEESSSAPPTSPPDDTAADARIALVETVLHAWSEWCGTLTSFCEHLRQHHRVQHGNSLITTILFEHGQRTPKRRGRSHADEHALRGAFETFFPGAQWVGDGTEIVATLDGERFTYNLELMVDAHSGALVGISIRDTEDAEAVIEAFSSGLETAQEAPLAVLLDNRPSNHTQELDEALADTLRIRATSYRAQNKAHVEGAFGLFAQRAPDIEICTADRRELGRQVVALVATLFARVLNHRPRRDREGKSRVDIYTGTVVTDEERELARRSLQERLRKQERARRTRQARLDPRVRQFLDQVFERLGLLDPEHHFRDAIARYPLDDVADGVAIFDGKRERGTLPDQADARYLLGIVRNVHHVHESEAITHAIIRARLEAQDALLQPLARERDAILANRDDDPALRDLVDLALRTDRGLDRYFWLLSAGELIASRPDTARRDLFRAAARRIHATFAVPAADRSAAERILARIVWPLS